MNISLITENGEILSAEVLSAEGEAAADSATDSSTSTDGAAGSSGALLGSLGGTLLLPIVLLVAMYFLIFRPQRKQEKQQAEMRNNLQVGDEVVTIGGIVGIVISKKDDTVLIESGGDRNKLRVKTAAISENLTAHEEIEKQKAAAKKAKTKGIIE
ncbi:MAG: preprotein translocase subunit YajC [Ruminococcus sp.]|nr:preprotein translocase subunit YajC [Ruminococcus sp.]MBQ8905644.1 preprotein translocase subunit YajC [Ruminococcus sp.]